jgi:predicted metal-binding membrane protein
MARGAHKFAKPPSPGAPKALPAGESTPAVRYAVTLACLAISLFGWALLVWLSIDMGHPIAQLMMPMSSQWTVANLLAITVMWAVMMVAMMLPSALPMIRTFAALSVQHGERHRAQAFLAAYLAVWAAFSIAATGMQWTLQAAGWLNPMIASTSAALNATLLVIAGVYQFTPLKQVCLAKCRTPAGFLLGEWRPGVGGGFVMGLRHGLFCVGCCWVLMALLFVGGVMNLAWIVALSVTVAIEKLFPSGARMSQWLGTALIVAGSARLIVLLSN